MLPDLGYSGESLMFTRDVAAGRKREHYMDSQKNDDKFEKLIQHIACGVNETHRQR